MLKIIILAAIAGLGLIVGLRRSRERLLEELKALSDVLLLRLLRWTSRFGGELTPDGAAEQKMWRELRLRDLQGLAQRAKQKQQNRAK
ncbi:MAG: hypothetical protein HYU47_10270 [Deltaproteobacteria bacterium]|nr:hypothetical protein [Deltaproteobacteria bacterium]MBI2538907.1 hypothetical protein [Deltaproteobacteria bacterium]MBI3062143.1 hypothetical protein [Deltaproteobacteria bacterium]